ncbi:competence/damage-inducible protein A [Candidatus Latescibacterota bacterium]
MRQKYPVIEIVAVGDEILEDPGRDSNSRHIIDVLARAGFSVTLLTVVGDSADGIARALTGALKRADVVLVTGGLGPTPDDRTIEAAAAAFGLPLVLDEETFRHIEAVFRRRKRHMSDSNRKQAMLPEGAVALTNPLGTAPGVYLTVGDTRFYFLPGVPSEMAAMLKGEVLPRLLERFTPTPILTATIQISGISESGLFDRIRDIPGVIEAARFYPTPLGVTIRIVSPAESDIRPDSLASAIAGRLGPFVYSTSEQTLEEVIGALLIREGKTIAVAESCTGGFIADRLTNVPGSSRYFLLGVVSYSNESKHRVLEVKNALIETHGAVSSPVAEAMAEGVRRITGADIGVATTGIAGPGGGSRHKPVGRMYASLAHSGGTITKQLQFGEERRINKERMSQSVLDMVRYHLAGYEDTV